jgi:hypothetical protein
LKTRISTQEERPLRSSRDTLRRRARSEALVRADPRYQRAEAGLKPTTGVGHVGESVIAKYVPATGEQDDRDQVAAVDAGDDGRQHREADDSGQDGRHHEVAHRVQRVSP